MSEETPALIDSPTMVAREIRSFQTLLDDIEAVRVAATGQAEGDVRCA